MPRRVVTAGGGAAGRASIRALTVTILALLLAALLPGPTADAQVASACDRRTNNTYRKLLECVTVEGVREHQAAFQQIATNNDDPYYPGTRAAGTQGYAESVEYVAALLEKAGYKVTLDEFQFDFVFPALLQQLTPVNATYETGIVHGQRVR